MKLLLAVLVTVALLAGGCGSGDDDSGGAGSDGSEKPAKPKSITQKLEDAIEDTPNLDVRRIDAGKATLEIELKTPEGGFSDVDGGDFDRHAQQTFGAVYGKVKYKGSRETVIVFKGGLVDKATGKEVDANAAIYTLKRREADKIDWGDGDSDALYNIEWSIYRDFLHPAFR